MDSMGWVGECVALMYSVHVGQFCCSFWQGIASFCGLNIVLGAWRTLIYSMMSPFCSAKGCFIHHLVWDAEELLKYNLIWFSSLIKPDWALFPPVQ